MLALGCLREWILSVLVSVTDEEAGICILTEAGGVAFAGKDSGLSGKVDAQLLGEL